MFSKKNKLKLTDFECNLLINGMNEFRNMHGANDKLQLFAFEWHFVVGGKANSKIASWCENKNVNFYAVQDNKIDELYSPDGE